MAVTDTELTYKKMDLRLTCADLVAQDRRATGRTAGRAGELRREYERCMRTVLDGLRRINRMLSQL